MIPRLRSFWINLSKVKVFGFILLGSVMSLLFTNAAPKSAKVPRFASGRILVQPKAGLSDSNLGKILAIHGAKTVKKIDQINLHIVEVPVGAEQAMVDAISKNPSVKFAELDKIVDPDFLVNDPSISSEWHIPVIHADTAWDMTQGTGVKIAILDSGVAPTHPDLQANLIQGINEMNGTANTADIYGHGTRVAGAAAAVMNNSVGVAGVAGHAQIMPILVTDTTGSGYTSAICSGIVYAADHGARVANVSFGPLYNNSSVTSAASYMNSKNGLVVASACNYGTYDTSPQNPSVIVASATDSNDNIPSWSNYGNMVTVAAPGVGILTTNMDGTYSGASGTSFSSPITAGVIALMMSANPNLSAAQVRSLLQSSADDLGAPGWDIYYGYGRVNAASAVQAAVASVATDTQAPNVSISSPTSGSSVNGLVSVSVSASDNVGVTHVDIYAGGNLVGSDIASPYVFSFDSTTVADGGLTLSAKAYDAAGNIGTSSVSVSVQNTVDTTPPTVNILSPVDGAVAGKKGISVSATGSDNIGVVSMAIYVDGLLITKSSSASINTNLNSRKLSSGIHTALVTATDAAGNSGSSSVQFTK